MLKFQLFILLLKCVPKHLLLHLLLFFQLQLKYNKRIYSTMYYIQPYQYNVDAVSETDLFWLEVCWHSKAFSFAFDYIIIGFDILEYFVNIHGKPVNEWARVYNDCITLCCVALHWYPANTWLYSICIIMIIPCWRIANKASSSRA